MSDGGAVMNGAKKGCKHVFVKKILSKPVPTYCSYCGKLLWIWEGSHRNCTVCDMFLHETCFREVVVNAQRAAAQRAEQERRTAATTNGQPQAPPLLDGEPHRSPPSASAGGDWLLMDYDFIEKNSVAFVSLDAEDAVASPQDTATAAHVHELAEQTFHVPVICAVCQRLLLGFRDHGLLCLTCGAAVHAPCAAALPDSQAQMITPERRAALEQMQLDPVRASVISDTVALLDRFSQRNHRWQLGLLNPVRLNELHTRHAAAYEVMCAALPAASRDVTGEALHECEALLRYATAVYGKAFEEGFMTSCFRSVILRVAQRQLLNPLPEVNNQAVVDVLGVPRECLLFSRWGTKVLEPSFALLVDHAAKSIVLAFRGSLSDADFLTDACGQTRDFCGGSAHDGMSRAVDDLFADAALIGAVNAALRQRPSFAFYVTGHSLGAGLAQLFTIKATQERTFGVVPMAVVFAPPPAVTLPLADAFDANILSLVAGTDVVCRLQFNSLDRLGALMSNAADCNAPDLAEEMHIAGRILLLTHPQRPELNRIVHVRRVQAVLHEIFVSSDMLSNHLMNVYGDGLRAAIAARESALSCESSNP